MKPKFCSWTSSAADPNRNRKILGSSGKPRIRPKKFFSVPKFFQNMKKMTFSTFLNFFGRRRRPSQNLAYPNTLKNGCFLTDVFLVKNNCPLKNVLWLSHLWPGHLIQDGLRYSGGFPATLPRPRARCRPRETPPTPHFAPTGWHSKQCPLLPGTHWSP